jgi:hypothetical protein
MQPDTLHPERAPVQHLDIRRESIKHRGKAELRQACRIETAGEVAGVSDGLLQQSGDLPGGGRCRVGARRQLSGQRRGERGDACEILAQAVMQVSPDPLFFPVPGLDDFPFQPLAAGNVAGCGVDQSALRRANRVPLQPPVGAILASTTILKRNRCGARGKPAENRIARVHRNFAAAAKFTHAMQVSLTNHTWLAARRRERRQ